MMIYDPSILQFTAVTDVVVIRVDIDCVRALLAARPELADHWAAIIKQRLDAEEQARTVAKQRTARPTIQDILNRIEKSLKGPRRH